VSDPIGRRRATGINVSADQDLGLLRAVAGGEERALRTLFERHAPWLAARLRRRCNDDEVVADVPSDTFVAVWRGAHRFRGEGDVAVAVGHRRQAARLAPPRPPGAGAVAGRRARRALRAARERRGAGAARRRARRPRTGADGAVARAAGGRAGHVLDGLSTRDAARLLGIPQGTLKGRLRKAKAELRAALVAGVAAEGTVR